MNLDIKEPLLSKDTLFGNSQSGETADTFRSFKMAKAAGLKTLVVCKFDNSSMTRTADYNFTEELNWKRCYVNKKHFQLKLLFLWMLSFIFLQKLEMLFHLMFYQKELHTLREVPKHFCISDKIHESKQKRLSKRYLHGHGFFYRKRCIFPTCFRRCIKIKRDFIYMPEGYPAGEMKHGPIAPSYPELFTIALMPRICYMIKLNSRRIKCKG